MNKNAGKRRCSPDKETIRLHITMDAEAKRCHDEAALHYKALLGDDYSSSMIIRQALRLLATMLREYCRSHSQVNERTGDPKGRTTLMRDNDTGRISSELRHDGTNRLRLAKIRFNEEQIKLFTRAIEGGWGNVTSSREREDRVIFLFENHEPVTLYIPIDFEPA